MGKMIKFGPAGLGSVKDAVLTLKELDKIGLKACEIAFTYGVYIQKTDAIKIAQIAKKLDFKLSIHAPYWVNLNSEDKKKVQATKERILKCCEIGHYLNANNIVFHPGYYGKKTPQETFENIKRGILEMQKTIKEKSWDVKLCPETMGKINVFGSIQEISELSKNTGCGFCIDFAHILARHKNYNLEILKKLFLQKHWHCHFSGIEYGEKGEKHHKKTSEEEWKEILKNIPKDKEIIIINESPDPIKDSLIGLKIYNEIRLS